MDGVWRERAATSQRDLRPADAIVDSYFIDRRLLAAVAAAVGIPVTTDPAEACWRTKPSGEPDASARLDRRDSESTTCEVYATNLRVLALAGNVITDISPLLPGTATSGVAVDSRGIARVGVSEPRFNTVIDLSPLSELTKLRVLSIDGRPDLNITLPLVDGVLQTVFNPTPAGSDTFGSVVAANEHYIVISSPGDSTGAAAAGAVYVFEAQSGLLLRTLLNPLPIANDRFGSTLALDGDWVAVGTPNANIGATDDGAVYVFNIRTGERKDFFNPAPATSDSFGFSIALAGGRLAVGAPNDDPIASNAGAVYVFDLGTGALLLGPFGKPTPLANDFFGRAVAMSERLGGLSRTSSRPALLRATAAGSS